LQRVLQHADVISMPVRIFKPTKTAMQSGEARTHDWLLEFEIETAPSRDPLMGWTSSSDTKSQLRLEFATKDEAVAYAVRNGLAYTVVEPKTRRPIRKSYAENFKFGRVGSWTH
jgi:ETC complex I subunit conserved region